MGVGLVSVLEVHGTIAQARFVHLRERTSQRVWGVGQIDPVRVALCEPLGACPVRLL